MSHPPALDLNEEVRIPLTMAEFLVLSDSLERVERRLEDLSLLNDLFDEAEKVALWRLEGWLEKLNPVIFSEHYAFHLREAKAFLTRSEEND